MNVIKEQKVVIVTGANGGIGLNYCREMLTLNYHVVLACRNEHTGNQALQQLQSEFEGHSIDLLIVDMGSLESIKNFSDTVKSKYSRLDVLVHNAGVYFFDKIRKESSDGIELNYALHYIAPFALTAHLFELLKKTDQSKVVSMSSKEHHGFSVDQNDLQIKNNFLTLGNMVAYSRSKWAVVAFTYELERRIKKHSLNIHPINAHPGVSITGIQNKGNPTFIQKGAIWLFGKLIAGKPKDAAMPLVLASTKGLSGEFYGPTGFKEFSGPAGIVQPDIETKDEKAGALLWENAEKLTGITFELST